MDRHERSGLVKRILITGKGSYLGGSVERYLQQYNSIHGSEMYRVDTISLRDESWKNADFSVYDTVLHMVGMAHADIGNVSEETKKKYYEINCDLAVMAARKAKEDGAAQFIYMSSVIVYGDSAGVGKEKNITPDTKPAPANFYGDSKWQAEQKLNELSDDNFSVAIVRSPMVYGRGSKGNYPLLARLAEKMPVFPDIKNRRSMIYVENLAEFLRLLTERGEGGTFLPQNAEYVTTCEMVQAIGAVMGKKVIPCSILNPFVYIASHVPGKIGGLANKAFGSLTIDQGLSYRSISGYQIYSLEESIRRTHEN